MPTPQELLQKANEALMKANFEKNQMRLNEDRKYMVSRIGEDLANTIKPTLEKIASDNGRFLKEAINEIKQVKIPDISLPAVTMPEPRVDVNVDLSSIKIPEPRVNISPILKPEINFPKEMDIKGWVGLMGVDLQNPLPVQLRDASGNPVKLFENLTTLVSQGGGGGGKADFFTIKGFSQSAYSEFMNADGRLKVSVETGGSGLTDAELRASSVPVAQASGAIWSTYVTGALNSLLAGYESGDNRIKVELPTGSSGLTDTELRASAVPVAQVSGASWSTEATQAGTWNVNAVTSITNSVASALIDSSGVQYSGSNPVPISGSVSVSGAIASSGAYLLNGDGTYRDTMPVSGSISVSGSVSSTVAVGDIVSDDVDTGSAPIKIGGIARTANPTAVAAGDRVSATFDNVGRQVTRPLQVRGLIATAYVQLTNGTETTLLAGAASTFHDLIYIMGANNSDAAVAVDLRIGTGGSVVKTIEIPATGTAGVSLGVPIPMHEVAQAWTADMADITGTTVSLSASFSKEI